MSTQADAKKQTDVANLVASLTQKPAEQNLPRVLTGPERAAVLMLSLGQQYGAKIWKMLDDDELRQLSVVMSTLGMVEAQSVEMLMVEFVGRLSATGALMGDYD